MSFFKDKVDLLCSNALTKLQLLPQYILFTAKMLTVGQICWRLSENVTRVHHIQFLQLKCTAHMPLHVLTLKQFFRLLDNFETDHNSIIILKFHINLSTIIFTETYICIDN